MSLIGSLLKKSLTLLIPLFVLMLTPISSVQAQETAKPAVKPGDKACVQCHRKTPMQGFHSQAVNPNHLGDVNCSNCHGRITKAHRSIKGQDMMRYNKGDRSPTDQNSMCMSCHEPDTLRESFWQHDVHVTKVACTNCHVLHPVKDPMEGINQDNSAKIKLCVDCHSQVHQDALKKEKP